MSVAWAVAAAAGFLAGNVDAAEARASVASPSAVSAVGAGEDAAVLALPTTLDRVGRVLAPVWVNGKGPFRFILDTGANRSALSPRVAEVLGLVPSLDTPIEVHGVTGRSVLPAVEVGEIRAGNLSVVRHRRMPVLSGTMLADADGILGVEGLGGSRIDIDFEAGTVSISRSRDQPVDPDVRTVPVSLRHRGLLIADGRVGGVKIKAIIDTGAERTLGNPALLKALDPAQWSQVAAATVHGATPELTEGASFIAPTISLGSVELNNLEVTFGNLHVFQLWDLERQPALLIGMDLIGTVRRLAIDYRRREIRVTPWNGAPGT